MLSDMATMRAGKPAAKAYSGGKHCKSVAARSEQTMKLKGAQERTPGQPVIDVRLVFDVVNFYNKQIKVDSLNEHPTESCH